MAIEAPTAPPAPAAPAAAPTAPATAPTAPVAPAATGFPSEAPYKAGLRDRLRKAAGTSAASAPPAEPPKPPVATTEPKPSTAPTAPAAPTATEPDDDAPRSTEDRPEWRGKNGKISGWKAFDWAKGRLAAVEKDNVELRSKLTAAGDIDRFKADTEAARKRADDLEAEIRHVNYAKSQEYIDKYQRPYEEAWARATGEVQQLRVADGEGNSRAATVNDLLALANAPLDQIDELAEQWFGKSAARVIRHVEKVRDLSDAATRALDDARKNGAERMKQAAEAAETGAKALAAEIGKSWDAAKAADESAVDGLKPRDGDDEHNETLTKARTWVDAAYVKNARDPKLTPEQRAKVVQEHAAVRGRAIAYSSLKLEVKRLRAQIAERDKELAQFKASQPTGGNGHRPGDTAAVAPANPMTALKSRLSKYVT